MDLAAAGLFSNPLKAGFIMLSKGLTPVLDPPRGIDRGATPVY
jgi:hypothetical protein